MQPHAAGRRHATADAAENSQAERSAATQQGDQQVETLQAIGNAAVTVDLFQVGLAHHPPGIRRARQLEGHALADHRNVTVIGIARIGDEEVFTVPYRFAHARMKFAGRRVVEDQLKLGVLPDAHRAEISADAVLQVVAMGEGGVLEARARQCRAGLDAGIETGIDHEQVVVARLMKNVAGFALDQVAQHIVRHPSAKQTDPDTINQNRLVEHQRHRIVEARRRGRQAGRHRIAIRPVQEGCRAIAGERRRQRGIGAFTTGLRRGNDPAGGIDDEKLGKVLRAQAALDQRIALQSRPAGGQLMGQTVEMAPLLLGPGHQDAYARLGEGLEGLLDGRVTVAIARGCPAHRKLAGRPEPRQPATLLIEQRHCFTFQHDSLPRH